MYDLQNPLPAGTYPDLMEFTNNLDGSVKLRLLYKHREGLAVASGALTSTAALDLTHQTRMLETFALTMQDPGIVDVIPYDNYLAALGEGDPSTG